MFGGNQKIRTGKKDSFNKLQKLIFSQNGLNSNNFFQRKGGWFSLKFKQIEVNLCLSRILTPKIPSLARVTRDFQEKKVEKWNK